MLVRRVDAGLQALCLLLVRDVQKELQNANAVIYQDRLELVDLIQMLMCSLIFHETMNARRQDVLIMRPVEDADHAALRHCSMATPQEVVVRLKRCGHFERGDVAALRVYT